MVSFVSLVRNQTIMLTPVHQYQKQVTDYAITPFRGIALRFSDSSFHPSSEEGMMNGTLTVVPSSRNAWFLCSVLPLWWARVAGTEEHQGECIECFPQKPIRGPSTRCERYRVARGGIGHKRRIGAGGNTVLGGGVEHVHRMFLHCREKGAAGRIVPGILR